MALDSSNSNSYNTPATWRFYGLNWDQCQSLILAVTVMLIILLPQFLFTTSTTDSANDPELQRLRRIQQQKKNALLRAHLHAHAHRHAPPPPLGSSTTSGTDDTLSDTEEEDSAVTRAGTKQE